MTHLASIRETWFEFVHEKRFDDEMEKLLGSMPRADEFLRGVQEVLCRAPLKGKPIDQDGLVLVLFTKLPGHPGVGIYYTVRDERITLLSIRDSNGES